MARAKHATPDDIRDIVNDLTEQYLLCRTYGHAWKPQGAVYSKDRRTIHTTQICACESDRYQDLDGRNGAVIKSHINYSEGYLIKGLGRVTGDAKGVIRLATVTRSYGLALRATRKRAS